MPANVLGEDVGASAEIECERSRYEEPAELRSAANYWSAFVFSGGAKLRGFNDEIA